MEEPPSFWKLKKKVGKGAVIVKGLDKLLRHKKNLKGDQVAYNDNNAMAQPSFLCF